MINVDKMLLTRIVEVAKFYERYFGSDGMNPPIILKMK